ncbi:lectin-related protein-like [Syzygium oleosum]|uniref:lectin-related protein-like n=1 Tax=Syzygium oleosum TaxID=219896 RepID=UPI0024B9FCC1|nr:lectin-related protein-like [Syzygium oleosum]
MSFETRELLSLLLVLVLSLAIAFTASALSQGIDFSFQTFNDSIIQRQGDATYDTSSSIQITEANRHKILSSSVGWATYHEPMRLWDKATGNVADFTTQFTFVINSQNRSMYADGLTFFLVPNGSRLSLNSSGGNLAVVDRYHDPSNSSAWFVAVEFDTFYNPFDPNCSQVAHVAFIWFRQRSKRKRTYTGGEEEDVAIEEEFGQMSGPKKFFYKDLIVATDNFAVERLLGKEGFGRAYEGYLTSVNASVTIKKINSGSR